MIMIGSYIFMILSQMFAFYWHANEVLEQVMALKLSSVERFAIDWLTYIVVFLYGDRFCFSSPFQSLGIGDAIYNGAWPDFEEPIRKRLILIIARAQRPMVVSLADRCSVQ